MLIPIVSGLLSGIETLSQSKQNLEQPALELIELILRKLDSLQNASQFRQILQ
jgi:hypothetical protein